MFVFSWSRTPAGNTHGQFSNVFGFSLGVEGRVFYENAGMIDEWHKVPVERSRRWWMYQSADATMHTVLMLSAADRFSGGDGEVCILDFCIFTQLVLSGHQTDWDFIRFLTSPRVRAQRWLMRAARGMRWQMQKTHRVDRSTVTQRGFPRAQSLLFIWWSHVPCFACYWVSSHERRDFHARSWSPPQIATMRHGFASRNCRPVVSAHCNFPKDAFA